MNLQWLASSAAGIKTPCAAGDCFLRCCWEPDDNLRGNVPGGGESRSTRSAPFNQWTPPTDPTVQSYQQTYAHQQTVVVLLVLVIIVVVNAWLNGAVIWTNRIFRRLTVVQTAPYSTNENFSTSLNCQRTCLENTESKCDSIPALLFTTSSIAKHDFCWIDITPRQVSYEPQ